MTATEALAADFGVFTELIGRHAVEQPAKVALILGEHEMDWASLDAEVDRVAFALQRDGFGIGTVAAVCAEQTSIEAVVAFLGVLRAGGAVAPLPAWLAPADLIAMLVDSGAEVAFVDPTSAERILSAPVERGTRLVRFTGSSAAPGSFDGWLGPAGSRPVSVRPGPDHPFNIIYSSGTTGRPKGIVLSHAMRWRQLSALGYENDSVSLLSLSLYSNMALISLLPTLAYGGTVVLMPKFDAEQFLQLSQRWRVTHAMMVPVQARRLLDRPDFDRYDLSSYRRKLVAGAPSSSSLLAELLERWPGGLVQTYGMTEGGGSTALIADDFADKLHTVGRPSVGSEILILDDADEVLPVGGIGEVVGWSPQLMSGYLHQPELSREIQWRAADGRIFLRSGDLGRFDDDGFLQLVGRKKDMIISGGFNLYPSDLEAELGRHPAVYECSVVGVPSRRWGETPVAFVVAQLSVDRLELLGWFNARVGKNQRLTDLQMVDALPRNDNGKIVKRELQELYAELSPLAPAQ